MSTTPTTPAKKTAATPEVTQADKTKLLAEARTEAIGQLLDKYRSDFNTLMTAAAEKRNVTWRRKPTAEEKREAALRALLAEDPTLLDRVVPKDYVAPEGTS